MKTLILILFLNILNIFCIAQTSSDTENYEKYICSSFKLNTKDFFFMGTENTIFIENTNLRDGYKYKIIIEGGNYQILKNYVIVCHPDSISDYNIAVYLLTPNNIEKFIISRSFHVFPIPEQRIYFNGEKNGYITKNDLLSQTKLKCGIRSFPYYFKNEILNTEIEIIKPYSSIKFINKGEFLNENILIEFQKLEKGDKILFINTENLVDEKFKQILEPKILIII